MNQDFFTFSCSRNRKKQEDRKLKMNHSEPTIERVRLFVRIQGLSPIQLYQPKGLRISSILQIIEKYYSDLYSGKPPGSLIPHRVVSFINGEKFIEFRRKESKCCRPTVPYHMKRSICYTMLTPSHLKSF